MLHRHTRKQDNVCTKLSSQLYNLFKSETKEEAWKRLNKELKEHLSQIYSQIYSCVISIEDRDALFEVFSSNNGADLMDDLRNEIDIQFKRHREAISGCERCGEGICICLQFVECVIGLFTLKEGHHPFYHADKNAYNYDDPLNNKSPYRHLVAAVNNYATWYKKIPAHFTDGSLINMNIKNTCEEFKALKQEDLILRNVITI